jgi:2-dehydro-3-deoxy-D-arabinonate dehydratase
MYLTRHQTPAGPRWAVDGTFLPEAYTMALLLELPKDAMSAVLDQVVTEEPAVGDLLPPVDPGHEVWASGVTYLRSRDAREAESETGDIYTRVYTAERPELFLKALGWRVVGHKGAIRVRPDSLWNVPEPELTLVINRHAEIVGYCAGNDVSSRSIEGANPLYLPQAKVYTGSCALGPGIQLAEVEAMTDLPISLEIERGEAVIFEEALSTSQIKRDLGTLVSYLCMELSFPNGVYLMTGTGIVPPDEFTLQAGDYVRVRIANLELGTPVEA